VLRSLPRIQLFDSAGIQKRDVIVGGDKTGIVLVWRIVVVAAIVVVVYNVPVGISKAVDRKPVFLDSQNLPRGEYGVGDR
jgi:hypothetical protein